jgi:hypothetical protein
MTEIVRAPAKASLLDGRSTGTTLNFQSLTRSVYSGQEAIEAI